MVRKSSWGELKIVRRALLATTVAVVAALSVTAPAGAAPTAAITGTVRFDGTGAAPADGVVCVEAASTALETCAPIDPATGSYTVSGLEPDLYSLSASSPSDEFATEYYGDAYDMPSMTTIDLADGATSTADFSVGPGGSISGTVTDQTTGNPIPGVDVCTTAWPPRCTSTGPDGTYTLAALAPVPTIVAFSFDAASPYMGEYWDDQVDPLNATEILFATPAEAHMGIDAQLTTGASIYGVVTGEDTGAPVDTVTVCAMRISDFAVYCSTFDAATLADLGGYRLTKLPPGAYSVFFGNSPGYQDEYWDNQTVPQDANPVSLAGIDSVELNAALAPIDGSVTTTTVLPEVMPSEATTTTAAPTTAPTSTAPTSITPTTAMTSAVPATTRAPADSPTTTAATSSTTTTAAAQVLGARQAAASPTARTGRSFAPMLVLASALLGLGSALVMAERRRGLGR